MLLALLANAGAQTAHFSYAQTALRISITSPSGLAVDGNGNVFVADTLNNAVKEILAAGAYTTVNTLGSGFFQPQGIAVDGSGNVFVADRVNNAVKEILAAGGYPRSTRWAAVSHSPMDSRWTGAAMSSSRIPATMR